MKKNKLNVFKFDYLPLSYWKNWFINIKQFFRNFKWAYQRAVYGFCERDTFSLDCYLTQLLPETLDYLADNCHGYPGDSNDPNCATYEAWVDTLRKIAEHFRNSQEWNENIPIVKKREELLNKMLEYSALNTKDFNNNCTKLELEYLDKEKYDKYSKEFNKCSTEVQAFLENEKNNAFDLLKKYFFSLWD